MSRAIKDCLRSTLCNACRLRARLARFFVNTSFVTAGNGGRADPSSTTVRHVGRKRRNSRLDDVLGFVWCSLLAAVFRMISATFSALRVMPLAASASWPGHDTELVPMVST